MILWARAQGIVLQTLTVRDVTLVLHDPHAAAAAATLFTPERAPELLNRYLDPELAEYMRSHQTVGES
jgi:hypothetical protein